VSTDLEEFALRCNLVLPTPVVVDKKLGPLYTQDQLFEFSYDTYAVGYEEAYG